MAHHRDPARFTSDQLADSRRFRTFNVVDDCTRECLAIEVQRSIPGALVARVLTRLVAERGRPKVIVCDNGPEFIGRPMEIWAEQNGVRLHFIEPGKQVQNSCRELQRQVPRRMLQRALVHIARRCASDH